MRVVVVGAGEVGFNTALMLSREEHDVVLIEQNEALVERATEQLDALTIHGNGASPKLLAEAGVKKSDLLIATTNSDEVNNYRLPGSEDPGGAADGGAPSQLGLLRPS